MLLLTHHSLRIIDWILRGNFLELCHHFAISQFRNFARCAQSAIPERRRVQVVVSSERSLILAMAMHSSLHSTAIWLCRAGNTVAAPRASTSIVRCGAGTKEVRMMQLLRREAMAVTLLGIALPSGMASAAAPGWPPGPTLAMLCDADCEKELENIPQTTTASGLQYKDIVIGNGDSPTVCFEKQVDGDFVAMIPNGNIFDRSLQKGVPHIFRVGVEQVIKGLDEGILSMKAGGKRRLYIPGELAFPNGLGAARRPPRSLVVFDVCLIYIPGGDRCI